MSAKRPVSKGIQNDGGKEKAEKAILGGTDMEVQFDRLMIVSKVDDKEGAAEESSVYALTAAGFEALTDTEFEPAAGGTIECGTVGNGMRVIQVLKSEVRSYDGGTFFPFLSPPRTPLHINKVNGTLWLPMRRASTQDCLEHRDLDRFIESMESLLPTNLPLPSCSVLFERVQQSSVTDDASS